MRQFVTFIVLTALFAGCSSINTFKKTKHLDFKPAKVNIFDLTKKAIDTAL